jgi:hypothetical protein
MEDNNKVIVIDNNPLSTNRVYNDDMGYLICMQIASTSKSIKTIFDELGLSMTLMFRWLNDKDTLYERAFAESYARAKEFQADYLGEEILEIADDKSQDTITIERNGETIVLENREFINRSRVRIDARKWLMAKLKPRKYGDTLDLSGSLNIDVKQITGMKVE